MRQKQGEKSTFSFLLLLILNPKFIWFLHCFPYCLKTPKLTQIQPKRRPSIKKIVQHKQGVNLSNPKNFVSLFPFQKPYYHMCKILWFCQFDSWVVLMTYKYGSPQNVVIIGWKLSWFEANWNSDTEKRKSGKLPYEQ